MVFMVTVKLYGMQIRELNEIRSIPISITFGSLLIVPFS